MAIKSPVVGAVLGTAVLLALAGPLRADNFLLRGFTWFGYLEGKELRDTCAPGAPDRLRFVYNAVYQEQVRVYEATRAGSGAPGSLTARVLTKLRLSSFGLAEIFLGTRDPSSTVPVPADAFDHLVAATIADGYGDRVPDGLTLPSDGFYWIASGCLGGRWAIQGWVHPGERFEALRFPAILFAGDGTGVAINNPRAVDAGERMRARSGNQSRLDVQPAFDVKLTDNGIAGRMPGL